MENIDPIFHPTECRCGECLEVWALTGPDPVEVWGPFSEAEVKAFLEGFYGNHGASSGQDRRAHAA